MGGQPQVKSSALPFNPGERADKHLISRSHISKRESGIGQPVPVPHPFAFFLAKGWESKAAGLTVPSPPERQRSGQASHPESPPAPRQLPPLPAHPSTGKRSTTPARPHTPPGWRSVAYPPDR